ncbi:hypothetical protein OE749_00215 [Aestuariibacter sp. AA17]|uniref:Uncharacterized protein n=1 Tax=Fluctibacter corallii TaxID=2984329 RepID=A0ABT3A380_9ALTE|nr:hypothetical protein [Aestuariibacter sp. AA17]MCV2883118.1 hypothetical protein [Aestuariibacter sp. AA17]
MQSIVRTLSAIDILSEEMADEISSENTCTSDPTNISHTYIKTLSQVTDKLTLLQSLTAEMKDKELHSVTHSSVVGQYLTSHKLLQIHIKLLSCIKSFYSAWKKAEQLSYEEYDVASDEKLTLFQTTAHKARNTYKAVAEPLGEVECDRFVRVYGLCEALWGYTAIRDKSQ